MMRVIVRTSVVLLLWTALQPPAAHAQWGFPGMMGEWGFMGWGATTAEGDMARGMGALAMGAGFYNRETAVANSINNDTVMRWNEYVYESQKEANRIHHARLAQDRFRTNTALNQIQDRLRNNPELRDIHRGDALNSALDEIEDPRVYTKALAGGKVKIGGELIRSIPFKYASEAITVSVHRLTSEPPPASLQAKEFETDRTALKALAAELRKDIDEGREPNAETTRKMLAQINATEAKAAQLYPANTRNRTEANRYLRALHGLIAMLQTPAIDVILSGVENRPEATLAELLQFMSSFNLRFGAATTPQQRATYDALYPQMVRLRNEIAPALAASAPLTTTGTEPHDVFSGVPLEDLQKKAPAPPQPGGSEPK